MPDHPATEPGPGPAPAPAPAPERIAARFRTFYGAPLRHLLLMLACFTLTGWIVLRLAGEATAIRMLIWFLAAAAIHDLVLFPLYTIACRALARAARIGAAGQRPSAARLAVVNHIRIPVLGSALLFLVYLPGILRLGDGAFTAATGLTQEPYLARWLKLTVAMLAVSALLLTVRLLFRQIAPRA